MKTHRIAFIALVLSAILTACHKEQNVIKDPVITEKDPIIQSTRVVFEWTVDYPGKICSMVELSRNEDMSDAVRFGSDAETADKKFKAMATELDDNTQYFYRYIVWNPNNHFEMGVKRLTTLAINTPVVATASITGIATTSALGGGNVTDDGNHDVTERGICWSTSHNPEITGLHAESGSGLGSYTVSMTGLADGMTYYVRAYAINRKGVGYGEEVAFTTLPASLPTVTTAAVTHIRMNSAICGGEVVDDGNEPITERGVCWSTSLNPDNTGNHASEGGGIGEFQVTMNGLEEGTTYYVRAYAVNCKGTSYGLETNFTTHGYGTFNGYGFVNLGLPSGTLWATCNVGAHVPEDYGDYYSWGETDTKTRFNWDTYKYANGDRDKLTKYCSNASNGDNGYTDDLTVLEPGDDAATANWGDGWCMPTRAQWEELKDNTTVTMETVNGVEGRRFTADNGTSLFLPAAGYRYDEEIEEVGTHGFYLSSTLRVEYPYHAWAFYFYSTSYLNSYYMQYEYRSEGHSVRPVRSVSSH